MNDVSFWDNHDFGTNMTVTQIRKKNLTLLNPFFRFTMPAVTNLISEVKWQFVLSYEKNLEGDSIIVRTQTHFKKTCILGTLSLNFKWFNFMNQTSGFWHHWKWHLYAVRAWYQGEDEHRWCYLCLVQPRYQLHNSWHSVRKYKVLRGNTFLPLIFFPFRYCTAGFGLKHREGNEKISHIFWEQVFLFVYSWRFDAAFNTIGSFLSIF